MTGLPDHLRAYRQADCWSDLTIADRARQRAEQAPDTVIFLGEDAAPTYATLLTEAEALAVALTDLGLHAGDVISFQLHNCTKAAVINLAAAILGLVINPIVPIYRDAEVRQMLADCAARVFFHPGTARGVDFSAMVERLRPDLPALRMAVAVAVGGQDEYGPLVASGTGRTAPGARIDPDTVKLRLYTSGTTGQPKAVLHSHNTLARVEEISAARWGIGAGDVMLMPSPVTHISGYANGLEFPFVIGTRSVLMQSWNAEQAATLIDRHAICGTVAATPFLQELAAVAQARGTSLPSLRVFACGGAAVPPDLVRRANQAFARPCAFRVFGATEVPLVTLGFPPALEPERASATDGLAVDYQLRITDEAGADVPPGTQGEILVRGPSMFMGYADPAQTADALDPDGFFRTGDLGVLADGALCITGRKKDLIIRGGENISAHEIEQVLLRHPAVRDVAVVSMPHPRLGEGVCAFVVPGAPPPAAATLMAFVMASGLARQKCPERVEFIDELPRTQSGKPRKEELRLRIRHLLHEQQDA